MKPGFRFRFFYKGESFVRGPVVVKCDQDENTIELVQAFRNFMLAAGYAETVVNKALIEVGEEK